ncbi:MAG TPA: hypothetical protein PKX87_05320 [Alphaproteobacteria bacterium]|nr:hypothetical protein [Alphaproteobacteria bacterium]
MTNVTVRVRLFGAFRTYGEALEVTIPAGGVARDVREALARRLKPEDSRLVHDSALADDTRILDEEATMDRDMTVSVLPPVCGG